MTIFRIVITTLSCTTIVAGLGSALSKFMLDSISVGTSDILSLLSSCFLKGAVRAVAPFCICNCIVFGGSELYCIHSFGPVQASTLHD